MQGKLLGVSRGRGRMAEAALFGEGHCSSHRAFSCFLKFIWSPGEKKGLWITKAKITLRTFPSRWLAPLLQISYIYLCHIQRSAKKKKTHLIWNALKAECFLSLPLLLYVISETPGRKQLLSNGSLYLPTARGTPPAFLALQEQQHT